MQIETPHGLSKDLLAVLPDRRTELQRRMKEQMKEGRSMFMHAAYIVREPNSFSFRESKNGSDEASTWVERTFDFDSKMVDGNENLIKWMKRHNLFNRRSVHMSLIHSWEDYEDHRDDAGIIMAVITAPHVYVSAELLSNGQPLLDRENFQGLDNEQTKQELIEILQNTYYTFELLQLLTSAQNKE